MDFGQIKDEQRKLAVFAGKWTGTETMHPSPWDPKGGTATGRLESRLLDGFAVITEYEQERDGKVTYRGHGVYGWDPFGRCYVMHWVDNMGGAVHLQGARGEWKGNQLVYSASNPMGHSRYTYTLASDGQIQFKIEMSPDGQSWSTFMDAAYTRV